MTEVLLVTLLALDTEALQRRIDNQKFVLAAYRRQADLINTILDHIDKGTINDFCNERGRWIKDTASEIERMETVQKIRKLAE